MKDLIKARFVNGIRHFDTQVMLTECGEIPDRIKIPIEVQDGLFILNHYLFLGIILGELYLYNFQYQQGVYDRREQN